MISRGVKQGFTLAPVLFNTYVNCVTRILTATLSENIGINLTCRTYRSLFDLSKLKAKSKIMHSSFRELQYADDCALLAHSLHDVQEALSQISLLYTRMGIQINVRKTEVMRCLSDAADKFRIILEDEELKNVSYFRYLGSNLSASCSLDDEICYRIGQATSAFGRLAIRVFTNRDLSIETKVMVYQAVCLSSLLYCSESWTVYRRQVKLLERFHISSLQRILGVSRRDRILHRTVLEKANCVSIECIIN